MNQIEKIEKRINTILEEMAGDKARKEITDKIREAEASTHVAEDNMKSALSTGNEGAFLKAKASLDNAVFTLEMHRNRKNAMDKDPLITSGEYEDMVSQIMDALTEMCQADKAEAIVLCDKIRNISARNHAAIEHGNTLLHTLQADVYRFADCPLSEKTGVRFTSPAYMKQFKDYSLPAWVQYGMDENPQYGAMIEGMKG